MSEIKVDTLSNADGTERMDLAKGWINFNGTTATAAADLVGVNDSFNVISLVDNGTGSYTVNWDTIFADGDYCVVGSIPPPTNTGQFNLAGAGTAGSQGVYTFNDNGGTVSYADANPINVVAFGDLA